MTEEELFHAALALPPAKRASFLDEACAGNATFRAAVEALLSAHESPGSILNAANPPAALSDLAETQDSGLAGDMQNAAAGAHVWGSGNAGDHRGASFTATEDFHPHSSTGVIIAGRYKLEQRIGEGGMGEVWVAKQSEPVKRKVALKLIKAGMDSRAVVQRFEQERQALALMDHPNIAKVLDGGITADRRPFFVMELVNGLPLTKFCDEAKLGIRERLELFVPICQAVQHAHQKGIVHRDLKPANILLTLVDGKPVPKVIDFGVAKATSGRLIDESMATQFGAVVGTLEYMSPEQAGLAGEDIDTRSDIYSLGVILYELLTGLRPFDSNRLKKAALDEVIRIIREEEPSKPSTKLSTDDLLPSLAAVRHIDPKKLTSLLRGELDWVVMKCLEKQRNRRYETANGLARDIQRYLSDEPVEARPPSTSYRFRKFVSRNKGQAIAAGVFLVTLIGGIIGTSWGLLEARRQTKVAVREAEEKEDARREEAEQRQLAEQANQRAYAALKSFTDDFMGKVLGGRTKLTESETAVLKNAQKQWEVFAQSKGQSPEAKVIRSDGAEQLALVQRTLGMYVDVEENHRVSLELRTELVNLVPNEERYQLLQARAFQNYGSALRDNGKILQAEQQFRHAVEGYENLSAKVPDSVLYRSRLGDSLVSLGGSLREQGKWETTERIYLRALSIQEKLVAENPEKPESRWNFARSNWALAFLKRRQNQFALSEDYYRKAIATYQELVALAPTVPNHRRDLGALHRELGSVLVDNKVYVRGGQVLQGALDHLHKLVTEYPSVPTYRHELARSQRDYSRVLYLRKQIDQARQQLEQSQATLEKLMADNPTVLPYQDDLGLVYSLRGEMESSTDSPVNSLDWFDKGIRILKAALEPNPTKTLVRNSLSKCHAGRALALDKLERYAEALIDWNIALELAPPDRVRMYRIQRAESLLKAGKNTEAFVIITPITAESDITADQAFALGHFYAVAGKVTPGKEKEYNDHAMRYLQKSLQLGYSDTNMLQTEAGLAGLRSQSAFGKLLEQSIKNAALAEEKKP